MGTKQVNICLSEELISNLKKLANEEMRSLTSMVNFILKSYLESPKYFPADEKKENNIF